MNIITAPITKENEAVLALPNEPFQNIGQVIPIFDGEHWSSRIDYFPPERITEECFPDEGYTLETMDKGFHGIAASVDGEFAGFALLYEQWNKYLYLDNLLVLSKYRRKGVATALMNACMEEASRQGKLGIWLVCQARNVQAFRFYSSIGYTLGGMNLPVYDGTSQEGNADLYLYKKVTE